MEKTTKQDIERAYADWYFRQQQASGCGGPVLMACLAAAVILYFVL